MVSFFSLVLLRLPLSFLLLCTGPRWLGIGIKGGDEPVDDLKALSLST